MLSLSPQSVISALAESGDAATTIVLDIELLFCDPQTIDSAKNIVMSCIRDRKIFDAKYGFYFITLISREIDNFTQEDRYEIAYLLQENCEKYKRDRWIYSTGELIGVILDEKTIYDSEKFLKCRRCLEFAVAISSNLRRNSS